jgi:hypothetical protein
MLSADPRDGGQCRLRVQPLEWFGRPEWDPPLTRAGVLTSNYTARLYCRENENLPKLLRDNKSGRQAAIR